MKKFYQLAKALMICGLLVFAANAQIADSRVRVSLSCPEDMVEAGSTVTLIATVTGDTGSRSPTYNWSISSGTITSGQGTPAIGVQIGDSSENITATIEVGGIYSDPINTSCTFVVREKPAAQLYQELTFVTQGELKAIMDGYMNELNNQPAAQGYIVLYPPSPQEQTRVARFIRTFINQRGFDSPRIRIVVGKKRGDRPVLRFWVVPPGAEFDENQQRNGK